MGHKRAVVDHCPFDGKICHFAARKLSSCVITCNIQDALDSKLKWARVLQAQQQGSKGAALIIERTARAAAQ